MYDNGNTLTMQSQKNTVYNTAWYGTEEDYTNANGPMTILPVLEEKTSNWTNVNTQTYTMGTTTFKTNAYTGCSSYSECTANTYTLDSRTAKARMITLQEAADIGCAGTNKSCPIWMYNYLHYSASYGGTINDTTTANNANENLDYWTMDANSVYTSNGWNVYTFGFLGNGIVKDIHSGARAVVEINK